MTEDEAKTKWCHERSNRYLFMSISGATAASLVPTIEGREEIMEHLLEKQKAENDRCIGSECMQWLWDFQDIETIKLYGKHGYCGLGGKE